MCAFFITHTVAAMQTMGMTPPPPDIPAPQMGIMPPPPGAQAPQMGMTPPQPDVPAPQMGMGSAPVPAATPMQVPQAITIAPPQATPDLQPEQLKGQGILELSEDTQPLVKTNNKNIIDTSKNASKIVNNASGIVNTITKLSEDLKTKFYDTIAQIETFIQDAAFNRGKIEEQVSSSLSSPNK